MIALVITTTTAYGASTRAEYIGQVDPICRSAQINAKAATRSAKARFRRLVRRGMDPDDPSKAGVRIAVRFYRHLARVSRNMNDEIAHVPPAPGDEALISQWLGERAKIPVRLKRFARAFAHGQDHKARREISRAAEADFQADTLMQDFGFQYCAS